MPAMKSRKPKPKKTIKILRYHVCRLDGTTFVKIATYQRFVPAYRRQQANPGSFRVTEFVAIDAEASDLGTIYFYDENNNDMDRYF